MKTFNKISTSKLATRFDKELKTIIMNDLKALKAKNQVINGVNNQLAAA